MFEEYLQDSYEFLKLAQASLKTSCDREAKRYYRASVFYAAGAMEAFLNYIAESFAQANNLSSVETAFLNDKMLTFNNGKLIERTEFHKLDEKLKLLLHKFVPTFDFNSSSWSKLMTFKNLRDSLVHPKQSEDETEVVNYQKMVSVGLSAVIEIMNYLSKGIFKKPLRKQILDLIPE